MLLTGRQFRIPFYLLAEKRRDLLTSETAPFKSIQY